MEPETAEGIFRDFKGRRAGILKALTKDAEKLYSQCEPHNTTSLCLFGLPNKQWELHNAHNSLSPHSQLPVPKPGINVVRDLMSRENWFTMVGVHSHAWLHAVVAYHAELLNLNKSESKRIFNKIINLPSICEVLQERKSRKRAKLECGGLPKEIVVEILFRLSVLDVLRCRLVCKQWLSMIDDPCFVYTHLSNYKCNLDGCNLLVIEQPLNSVKRSKQVLVRRSDNFRKLVEIDYSSLSPKWEYMDVINYINGVMLMRKGISKVSLNEIALWNPSINVFVKVPNKFEGMGNKGFYELGLGFDAMGIYCKVIAVVYPNVERYKWKYGDRFWAKDGGRVEMYDLSADSWSTKVGVECPIYWTSGGSQVFFNGAIHWRNLGPIFRGESWRNSEIESHLVAFDVCNDVFKYFELPAGADIANEQIAMMVPVIVDESLAMFYAYEWHNDIWVMKEYSVEHSWSKHYNFSLQFDTFLQFKMNGEFLFAFKGKGVKSYDFKSDRIKDLAKTYSQSSSYTIYTYVESLVLSKQVDKQPSESSSTKLGK